MSTRDAYLLSLCLWREARGESIPARAAVLHVILNRMAERKQTATQVVLWPKQFSSFNVDDPNSCKFPMPDDHEWIECCALVDNPGEDPTGGANHYESCPEGHDPKWADDRKRTAIIGPFEFYKL